MLLLRRAQRAVGEIQPKEWALLGFESIGVLIGIFLAFQLNEWASDRKEAARNRQVVERLFEESQVVTAQLRAQRDDIKQMADRESSFATALVRDGICPAEDAWLSAFTTNMFPPIAIQNSVYEEMMGAGGLSTIEDTRSRHNVSAFQAELAWFDSQTNNHRANVNQTVKIDDPRINVTYDPNAEEPLSMKADREALCADKAFRNRVADAVRDHEIVYTSRSDLTVSAIKMCKALGIALKKECVPEFGGPLKGNDAKISV